MNKFMPTMAYLVRAALDGDDGRERSACAKFKHPVGKTE